MNYSRGELLRIKNKIQEKFRNKVNRDDLEYYEFLKMKKFLVSKKIWEVSSTYQKRQLRTYNDYKPFLEGEQDEY